MIETAESRNSFCSSRVCGVVEEEEAIRNIAHTHRIFFPVSFSFQKKSTDADISRIHLHMRSVDDISFKKEEEREIWNGV